MRRWRLAIIVTASVVASACAPLWSQRAGDPPHAAPARACWDWSVPGPDTAPGGTATGAAHLPPFVDHARAALLADRCLRLNQLQAIGTHNSYHVQAREPYASLLPSVLSDPWEYTHPPLPVQFSTEGVRQIELDVWADPDGGRFAERAGPGLLGLPTASGVPELDEPGIKVLHVNDFDFESTCWTLVECLEAVKGWSDDHPGHLPIAILLELKDNDVTVPGGAVSVPFGPAEMDGLDAEIRSVFPPEQVITPDDVRGDFPTLEDAVLTRGWPTLGEAKGRVLFLMDNGGSARTDYLAGHPSLAGRMIFTNSTPGHPDAAFVKRNDPVGAANQAAIHDLVEAGYVVRTRADEPTEQARSGDTTMRDAALASGAQWVSTDYPSPDGSPFSDYEVTIPDGHPARCNPLVTGPACRDDALEHLG